MGGGEQLATLVLWGDWEKLLGWGINNTLKEGREEVVCLPLQNHYRPIITLCQSCLMLMVNETNWCWELNNTLLHVATGAVVETGVHLSTNETRGMWTTPYQAGLRGSNVYSIITGEQSLLFIISNWTTPIYYLLQNT